LYLKPDNKMQYLLHRLQLLHRKNHFGKVTSAPAITYR